MFCILFLSTSYDEVVHHQRESYTNDFFSICSVCWVQVNSLYSMIRWWYPPGGIHAGNLGLHPGSCGCMDIVTLMSEHWVRLSTWPRESFWTFPRDLSADAEFSIRRKRVCSLPRNFESGVDKTPSQMASTKTKVKIVVNFYYIQLLIWSDSLKIYIDCVSFVEQFRR